MGGRTKEYYYWDVKKWIMAKDTLPSGRMQVAVLNYAINEALAETEKLPNGDLRVKAIEEILFKKTKTYEGVALEIHYEWRTIQNWVTAFVNLVGRKAGF